MELMIEDLMEEVVERGGSDLHLSTGLPPYIRISGQLTPTDHPPMSADQSQRLIFSMLNNSQRNILELTWELDCSYGVRGLARFRVNVYKDRGTYAACLRALSSCFWVTCSCLIRFILKPALSFRNNRGKEKVAPNCVLLKLGITT